MSSWDDSANRDMLLVETGLTIRQLMNGGGIQREVMRTIGCLCSSIQGTVKEKLRAEKRERSRWRDVFRAPESI